MKSSISTTHSCPKHYQNIRWARSLAQGLPAKIILKTKQAIRCSTAPSMQTTRSLST